MKKRGIVTKSSANGEFQVGDHIVFYAGGDIGNREAGGWIVAENVPAATEGMEWRPDEDYRKRRIQELRDEINKLETSEGTGA